MQNLEIERSARLKAATACREDLCTQINRIHTLFPEQGVTIASVLTAIGLAISTLVLALTGGGGTPPAPALSPALTPADMNEFKKWLKINASQNSLD